MSRKKTKSFRLDDETIKIIEILKEKYKTSEAEIVEKSVKEYFKNESNIIDKVKKEKDLYKNLFWFILLMIAIMIVSDIISCLLYEKIKSLL